MDPIRIPSTYPKQLAIHWISATESPEFGLLSWALTHSSIVALDAEWKPRLTNNHSAQENETNRRAFPHVSILQLACRLVRFPPDSSNPTQDDSLVFLLDLQTLPLASVYDRLKEMFVSQNVLKLGFRFKQDLTYLSSTFCSHGFEPGFDRVEPFIDISNVYNLLQPRQPGRISRNQKSLAAICEELLGVSISKEVQCSDWSQRPLTEEQRMYAAIDAHCLLEIFTVFQFRVDKEGGPENDDVLLQCANSSLDTNLVREKPTTGEKIVSIKDSETSDVAGRTSIEFLKKDPSMDTFVSGSLCSQTIPLDESPSEITAKHGSKILLEESDKRPRPSRMRAKKQTTSRLNPKARSAECVDDWQGPIEFLKKDPSMDTFVSGPLCSQTIPLDESLSEIIGKYGSKILLEESDKRPRPSRMRAKKQTKSRRNPKAKSAECVNDWQGPIEFLKKDPSMDTVVSGPLCSQTIPLDESLSEITGKYGSKILLEELDKRPRPSRMRAKKQTTSRLNPKAKSAECVDDWQGPIEFLKKDPSIDTFVSGPLCSQTIPLDESLSEITGKYGSKILLEESDKRPRPSRMRAKKQTKSRLNPKAKSAECVNDWQGPVPWDISKGGDGRPKFLCDTTLEGLAKYLRCVGIDAAVPHSQKHVNRKLIVQALGDKRLLLTRDAKLLRYKYLIENQIYIVKNLGKDKQLNEVIKTFHLKILEDQILSRCTKCNGTFIQRPLTTEEAIKAAEGFQKIPDCVLNKNLEFWLCMHCRQVYWKLDSAKQKFRKFCDLIK